MSKHQQTGMHGVYLVAAELTSRGLIVSPTSRSAAGADLLVTDQSCEHAFSVQVKTNAKPVGFWLAGQRATVLKAPTHIYVFVNIDTKTRAHEYFVVPSDYVAEHVKTEVRAKSTWYAFYKRDATQFRDAWSLLCGQASSAA